MPERQSSLFGWFFFYLHFFLFFFFFCWLGLSLVIWPRFDDPFVSQNPREVCVPFIIIINIIISLFHASFSNQLMVFHWCLSNRKSTQISRTLPCILAELKIEVVWTVSAQSPISISFNLLSKLLVIVLNASFTRGILETYMFHSIFSSLARSNFLSLSFLCFLFFGSLGQQSSPIVRFPFICY